MTLKQSTIRLAAFAVASLGFAMPLLALGDSPPNIIILYADDLGYGDLACYNPKSPIPTPNLDALALQGMRFTDAHSSSGICTPSRYALLTGRHHWRDFHDIVNSFEPSVFPKGRLTMAKMLQSEGYHTAAIGKWHLGWDWNAIKKTNPPAQEGNGKRKKRAGLEDYDWSEPIPGGPLSAGFDHYFGEDVINFPPYCWFVDDKIVQAPDRMLKKWIWEPVKEGKTELRPGPMAPDWNPYEVLPKTTRHAVEFIKSRQVAKQPFFLYFAYASPHAPIIPNKEFLGKSGAGPYGDYLVETDHSVGQILAALKESGLDDNTLVIFTADNGPEYFAYERDEKFNHWSAQPLRGLKRDIYEGGHRVPFLVKWPGVVPPDSVCDALVSQVDLMATLAAVVGTKLPDNAAEDSLNLLPLFQGGNEPVRENHVYNTTANTYAIRHGDWVLVDAKTGYGEKIDPEWDTRHGYPAEDSQPAELYNLKDDIAQKNNLASAHPEKVEELRGLLKKIQQQGHSAPRLVGGPQVKETPYRKVDGHTLSMKSWHPPGWKKGDPLLPGVVMFFGGGWNAGDTAQFDETGRHLAQRGMIVVAPEYRTKKNGRATPDMCLRDAKTAMRHIRKHAVDLGIDPDRILAGGRSAGGHLAAACAFALKFDTPGDDLAISTTPKALILFNPVIDNGPGGYGHQRVEPYWQNFSPLHNIPANPPPTLFISGDKDAYIPIDTARKFQAEIQRQGGRCDLVALEGGRHGSPFEDRFFQTTLQAVDAFLDSLGYLAQPLRN